MTLRAVKGPCFQKGFRVRQVTLVTTLLDPLRQFSQAMARARSKKKRRELWAELLHTLAADLVPERPGRREPRAAKRKKNKYPRLDLPRRKFRDHPKRNVRRKNARLRRLGLM